MHRRGIRILPGGGDYGFAWTPHGTYARDLQHFVELLDFTPDGSDPRRNRPGRGGNHAAPPTNSARSDPGTWPT